MNNLDLNQDLKEIEEKYHSLKGLLTKTSLELDSWYDLVKKQKIKEMEKFESKNKNILYQYPKATKFFSIKKSRKEKSYDFNLIYSMERIFINNVKPDSTLFEDGLRDQSEILEINGKPTNGMSLDEALRTISENEEKIDLLVSLEKDKEISEKLCKAQKESYVIYLKKERLDDLTYFNIVLLPNYEGIGLNLTATKVIARIDPFSPADLSGLKIGDQLITINDINIKDTTLSEIGKILKQCGKRFTLGIKRK